MAFPQYRMYYYRPDKQPRDLDTLLANQVWSAPVGTLNDPYEFAALSELHNDPDKQASLKNAGVTCFCRSLTNPLLWSHYAAAHCGFAIGYDYASPFFAGTEGPYGGFIHDVRYEDVAPSLTFHPIDTFVMAAMLTKPTCWAYEQEVRLIKQHGNQKADIPTEAIKEIAFGTRMPKDRVQTIMAAVSAAGIKARFIQMQFIKEGYGVKPEWIKP